MSTRTKILTATMLAASALVAFAAPPAPAADPAPLRVGIAANYPPLAFKQDGQLRGIEVDFANRLGKALDRPVVLVETPWDDLAKALIEDQTIDVVMSGTSITEARKQRVDFTDAYLDVGQMVLVRNDDYPRLRNAAALDDAELRVGFISNTTSQAYAREHLTKAKLEGFADADDGVAALRANKIDAFIADAPAVWRVSGGLLSKETQLRGLYTPLTKEQLAWAVRKGDDGLRAQLNAVLTQWEKDGTLDDVIDDWITVKKTTIEVKPRD
jgi:ABC-type amino acid transport substrate-binding protein